MRTTTFAALALLVATTGLAATREIDETLPASPDGSIEIELIAGEVEIVGWGRDEVRITGSYDDRYEELDISSDDDEISIEIDFIRSGKIRNTARLRLQVPKGSSIEIETISANCSIEGVSGELSIESVSGETDIEGPVTDVEAATVSGSIDVRSSARFRSAEFETVTGDIDVRGRLARDARVSFESVNGDLTLRLPADSSARFSVETFNGKIENQLGPKARSTSDFLNTLRLEFEMGKGQARVDIESFGGNVRLLED